MADGTFGGGEGRVGTGDMLAPSAGAGARVSGSGSGDSVAAEGPSVKKKFQKAAFTALRLNRLGGVSVHSSHSFSIALFWPC